MIKKTKKKVKYNLLDEINEVAKEINNILDLREKDRYFEGIAILHSFIEDVLKWLIFTQILWNKSENVMSPKEVEQIKIFCNNSNLFSLLNLGLSVGLLDYILYQKLDEIRKERNYIVHQYWLYIHKGKKHILRKKLEKLAGVANTLVKRFNELVEETGIDNSYGFFNVSLGKNFILI